MIKQRTIKSAPKEGNLDKTSMEMSVKLTHLSRQIDILFRELASLKKSHRENIIF